MVLVVAYLLMPIDIIPDFLLLFGLVDDILIISLAVSWIMKRLPAEIFGEPRSARDQRTNGNYADVDAKMGEGVTIDGTSKRM